VRLKFQTDKFLLNYVNLFWGALFVWTQCGCHMPSFATLQVFVEASTDTGNT